MSVMEYHNNPNDPFTTTECENRENNYYGYSGHPAMWFDGVLQELGSTNYRPKFDTRKTVESPLSIELNGSYNSSTRQGIINAHITNTTSSTVGGLAQFVLTETNIPYVWQSEDSLFDVVRKLMPNENGEQVVISAGGSVDKSQGFTVNSSWVAGNCNIIVFVQGASHEIYQGAKWNVGSHGIEEADAGFKKQSTILRISPNPFSQLTIINYQIPVKGKTSLSIYDLSGRVVKTLVNEEKKAGSYNVNLNTKGLSSGIYFARLCAGNYKEAKKLIFMK